MRKILATSTCLLLASCTTAQNAQVAKVSADIQQACTLAQPVIAASLPFIGASPVAAGTAVAVQAGCTLDGMVQMTANDGKPITPTNSGNSAAWVQESVAFVNSTAAAVQAVQAAIHAPAAK